MPRTRVKRNAITFDVLVSLFKYTMDEAAQIMGTSVSMLKRACRDHSVFRSVRIRDVSRVADAISQISLVGPILDFSTSIEKFKNTNNNCLIVNYDRWRSDACGNVTKRTT
jgi:hypothetical protein